MDRRLGVPLAGALTLVLGFAVAQGSGNRALGGAVLVVGAAGCVRAWWRRPGRLRALAAAGVFAVAFAVSHPLGHVIGAWPSVLLVSAVAAAAAWAIGRSPSERAEDATIPDALDPRRPGRPVRARFR